MSMDVVLRLPKLVKKDKMPVYKDFHAFIFDDFFKIYIISKSDWWFSLDYLHPTARRNIYAILGILINI